MMKNKNRGFSLAELLIALGIIGIIATIGIVISKKGIDRAYNLYYYTGYMGISNAIADAANEGYTLLPASLSNGDFTLHIIKVLDAEVTSQDCNSTVCFKAPNGVSYGISTYAAAPMGPDGQPLKRFLIKMTVPQKRGEDANKGKVCLGYFPDEPYGVLIPFPEGQPATCQGYRSLFLRKDLLPFYFDTGVEGRVIASMKTDENGNVIGFDELQTFTPRKFDSFQKIACNKYSSISGVGSLGCSSSGLEGAIMPANPRSVR